MVGVLSRVCFQCGLCLVKLISTMLGTSGAMCHLICTSIKSIFTGPPSCKHTPTANLCPKVR